MKGDVPGWQRRAEAMARARSSRFRPSRVDALTERRLLLRQPFQYRVHTPGGQTGRPSRTTASAWAGKATR